MVDGPLNVTVLYVGSSLLGPLKKAEQGINQSYQLNVRVAAYNFGSPFSLDEWSEIDSDLKSADVVFVIHVMDGENATLLISALEKYKERHHAVIVINCMPELMRHTRMKKLNVAALSAKTKSAGKNGSFRLLGSVGSWVGRQATSRKSTSRKHGHAQYLKLIDRLPGLLKFVPSMGALADAKHYLNLFCYFLQPTPQNIEAMVLYSLKHYVPDKRLQELKLHLKPPEHMPAVAIYHPSARELFSSFDDYRRWYREYREQSNLPVSGTSTLDPDSTIGLLLMRPQVVSRTTKHYDKLITEIEHQGLSVVPAIATLMDNREATNKFFIEKNHDGHAKKRVSQIVSLTGFSFVGGPAMNDSEAASEFLSELNIPYRSAVSLDTQSVESWRESQTGLNPVQAGMQIAIPEIDGATEPIVFGGISSSGHEPVPLEDRCHRLAKRISQWNRLQTAPRSELRLGLVLFCFPPNKGNIGTAADLDVFPSVWDLLNGLTDDGYRLEVPETVDALRNRLIVGNSDLFGAAANVAYRMSVKEYREKCSYVDDVETDWGPAPGSINSLGKELLIQGLHLENIFIGVQPTFGFEGDPMRLMMARSGSPHHGFAAFYTYLTQVFKVDAIIHVGTHGALEFMPGKQVGLSGECWPDRLIGEVPNFYLYSVNNPSEGSIAKRRSYAELISYLTPPIENAGLYKDLERLKDLILAYRQSADDVERESLFETIEEMSAELKLNDAACSTVPNHRTSRPAKFEAFDLAV